MHESIWLFSSVCGLFWCVHPHATATCVKRLRGGCAAWMRVRRLLCSGLNASILLAVVYGVMVDRVTYWAYKTAHFIGRPEKTRGVCLTHSCSLAMCVTPWQRHAELDWPSEYHGSMSPKAGHSDTYSGTSVYRHTHKHLSVDGETQTLPLFVFSNLSRSFVPIFLSQSAVFRQWLLSAHGRSSQERLKNVLSDFVQLRK